MLFNDGFQLNAKSQQRTSNDRFVVNGRSYESARGGRLSSVFRMVLGTEQADAAFERFVEKNGPFARYLPC